jgi:uncharacterized protein (UPF0332 family)
MVSQASKQVDWCLKKAEKELEECKKSKIKPRHRGLQKIKPDKRLSHGYLDKATHNLTVFRLLKENNASDWSVTVGFYSIYHCFLAIAAHFGYESRNQTCTVSLIESLNEEGKISIDKEIIDFMKYEEEENSPNESLIELREDYTYGTDLEIKDQENLDKIEKRCVELIDKTREIIYG